MTDTVFALATAPGRAAIAVMRVSGPATGDIVTQVCGPLPRARRATLRTFRDAAGRVIDRGLILWFPGPGSYTGEDCAEFHIHGGPVLIDELTRTLAQHGLRLAAPGEFSRRAFDNGRLELDQVEAVADLIDAETSAQARQALGQLQGAIGRRFRLWREELIGILSDLEGAIDFPDEELPPDLAGRAAGALTVLRQSLAGAAVDATRGRRIRDGYKVAIIGAPNAGKSSLFNYLLGRDAAIVTPVAGSTRDVIEAPLDLDGYRVLLADMAGIRDANEMVELEGVRRARQWSAEADLRIWVVDGSSNDEQWRVAADLVSAGDLCVLNKSDLPAAAAAAAAGAAAAALSASVHSAQLVGVADETIRSLVTSRVLADLAGGEFPAATRARHAALIAAAQEDLSRALGVFCEQPELAAEDVRNAAKSLEGITGRIGSEDVLASIFSRFCIGK